MATLTETEKTEYKEHIFLGNVLLNEARIAIREGCTRIARTKLDSALGHYRAAYNISAGKSAVGTSQALAGINDCKELISAITKESIEK